MNRPAGEPSADHEPVDNEAVDHEAVDHEDVDHEDVDHEPLSRRSADHHCGDRADPEQPPILVSACLLGVACNHRAEGKPVPALADLATRQRLIPVCPEVAGGLPTPRPAAERGADGRVRTASGDDVTDFYERGANHAVAVARTAGVRCAVLKARSPSCGCHEIYDGIHQRVLVAGEGVTAQALRKAGVEVVSEEDL